MPFLTPLGSNFAKGYLPTENRGVGNDYGWSQGVIIPVANRTGSTQPIGSVVYMDTSQEYGKLALAATSTPMLGVIVGYYPTDDRRTYVEAPAPTGRDTAVMVQGLADVQIASAVTRGQYITASSTAGKAQGTTAPANAIGVVLQTSASGSAPVLLNVSGSNTFNIDAAGGGVTSSGWFGDGTDGGITFDGATDYTAFSSRSGSEYTLTRDIIGSNITVNSGVTVKPAGYRIFCKDTLTNAGTIQRNGNNASGGTAGGALNPTNTTLGVSYAGGNGGTNANGAAGGQGANPYYGGDSGGGGASGAGQLGGTGRTTGTGTANVAFGTPRFVEPIVSGQLRIKGNSAAMNSGHGAGGGGGAAASTGGGGGGGAAPVSIAARIIVNSGTISSTGGAGGNGSGVAAGGGGGGGGGLILLAYASLTNTGTISADGGAAGSGIGTGSAGVAGGAGNVFQIVA